MPSAPPGELTWPSALHIFINVTVVSLQAGDDERERRLSVSRRGTQWREWATRCDDPLESGSWSTASRYRSVADGVVTGVCLVADQQGRRFQV